MKKVKTFLSLSVIVFLFFVWLIYELFFIGKSLFSTHEIPFYIVLVLPLLNIILFSSLFIRYKKILAQLSFIFYVFAITLVRVPDNFSICNDLIATCRLKNTILTLVLVSMKFLL